MMHGAREKVVVIIKAIKVHHLGTVRVCLCKKNNGGPDWSTDRAILISGNGAARLQIETFKTASDSFHQFLAKNQLETLQDCLAYCSVVSSCMAFRRALFNLKALYNK